MLSDTMLGIRTFVLGGRGHALESAVMATYTSAQWFISQGVNRR